jgi:hypothetical protein
MDKLQKLGLIQRSLGIRHKLKVHESMKSPDSHEDIALGLITRWELEDELRAIEELLTAERQRNVASKRQAIEKDRGESMIPGISQLPSKKKSRK